MPISKHARRQNERHTDAELNALFDQLFPHGFAGADVLDEIAPDGWEQSSLLACFHPSVERVFEERLLMHRNLEELRRIRISKHGPGGPDDAPEPVPTLEALRREYEPRPVQRDEEVTELVGSCLWDVFSDNHDVITADGRVADIGSFRGASAFLDEYLRAGDRDRWCDDDYTRFYMGTIWISGRADLTPVYAMIFRRLKALGADWVYHFPELYLTELAPIEWDGEQQTRYSVPEAAITELKAQKKRAEMARFLADVADMNARAREAAMGRRPPATVRGYREVYGRDPRGGHLSELARINTRW
jgi:hypothetical protein